MERRCRKDTLRAAHGQETTFHDTPSQSPRQAAFTNVEQETPSRILRLLRPSGDRAGIVQLKYRLSASTSRMTIQPDSAGRFIHDATCGRALADHRMPAVLAAPACRSTAKAPRGKGASRLAHRAHPHSADFRGLPAETHTCLLPGHIYAGLDVLPSTSALNVKPTHGDYVPMNIEVKPLWRCATCQLHLFSQAGSAHLWLDTRDRILPTTGACSSRLPLQCGFNAAALDGAEVRLIFKPYKMLPKSMSRSLTQCATISQHDGRTRKQPAPENLQPFYADITDCCA